MADTGLPQFDPQDFFVRELELFGDIESALSATLERATDNATMVLQMTGDIASAIESMGFYTGGRLEQAVQYTVEHDYRSASAARPPDPVVFQEHVLSLVGGGGITGIPTAQCLHAHLPPGRKPTRIEMEEAWGKCQGSHP